MGSRKISPAHKPEPKNKAAPERKLLDRSGFNELHKALVLTAWRHSTASGMECKHPTCIKIRAAFVN